MNKHIDQTELGKQIAQATGLSKSTADAFIVQFFAEIENNLINNISSNINGLGIFRIIKSGNSNKILFLGSRKNTKQDFITKENLTNLLLSKSTNSRNAKTTLNAEVRNTSYTLKAVELDKNKTSVEDDNIIFTNQNKTISPVKDEFSKSDIIVNNVSKYVLDKDAITTDVKSNIHQSCKEDKLETRHEKYQEHEYNYNEKIEIEQIKREEKKKNAIILPIFISLLILVIIIGVSYLLFENAKKSSIKPTEDEYSVNFHELSVNDSLNINSIVIPDKDVSLEYIARTFYGNEIFWPYIYIANEDFMNNSSIALAGSIIKIPRLTVDLVAYNDGSVTTAAQKFGDEIRKSKKID